MGKVCEGRAAPCEGEKDELTRQAVHEGPGRSEWVDHFFLATIGLDLWTLTFWETRGFPQ